MFDQYSCSSLSAEMMCAANPSTDSCQGDSGGPLVTKDTSSGNYIQTGISIIIILDIIPCY